MNATVGRERHEIGERAASVDPNVPATGLCHIFASIADDLGRVQG
jgi:hypothetical protein